ncbi:MAG: hypothetical protein PHC51_04390 [bacterium]|nr:hypothetical protein [bacterium]
MTKSAKLISQFAPRLLQAVVALLIFCSCSIFDPAENTTDIRANPQDEANGSGSGQSTDANKITPPNGKTSRLKEAVTDSSLPDYLNPRHSKHPIEVVWSAPDKDAQLASNAPAPDFYIIEYGVTPDAEKTLRIPARQLVATSDDVFGSIYRVYLHDTPEDQVLYVRIRSATDSTVSEPSVTFEIHPGTGWGKRLGAE